jgi:hypothetical protein
MIYGESRFVVYFILMMRFTSQGLHDAILLARKHNRT